MPKVSIVIPCLNSAKYIRETLDSAVSQSFRDLEIVVVDAGSTDGTIAIIEEYATADKRVRHIHSEKRSMGHQYNLGIDSSTAEYVMFLESDDFYELTAVEKLFETIEAIGADYVRSSFVMFANREDKYIRLKYSPIPNKMAQLYGRVIAPIEYPFLIFRDVNIWNGVYRKRFLEEKGIRFNDTPGAAFQDTGFVVQTLLTAGKAVYTDDCVIHYRRDNESSSVYKSKAYKFLIDEFVFIDKIMVSCPVPLYIAGKIFDRYWNVLVAYSGRYLIANPGVEISLGDGIINFAAAIERLSRKSAIAPDAGTLASAVLLRESPERFYERIRADRKTGLKRAARFALACENHEDIVIFGAGEVGQSTAVFLEFRGLGSVRGFCDNSQEIWGNTIADKPIRSPEDAVREYPNAIFIIAAMGHEDDIYWQLINKGISEGNILVAPELAPHYAFELPYELWEEQTK
jgi:glycosyltransferase involved in cell wall biosynthesis